MTICGSWFFVGQKEKKPLKTPEYKLFRLRGKKMFCAIRKSAALLGLLSIFNILGFLPSLYVISSKMQITGK